MRFNVSQWTFASTTRPAAIWSAALVFATAVTVHGQTPSADEYPVLDHVQGSMVLTNAAPVRPLLWHTVGLFSVNTTASTIEVFDVSTPVPTLAAVRRVPWGPVSIAVWDKNTATVTDDELLVVCRNSWGLLKTRLDNGRFLSWTQLPAEPTDIVLDDGGLAYVACMGADSIVVADATKPLTPVVRTYDERPENGGIQIKSPYRLTYEPNATTGFVYVTPLHSGNNTTAGIADFTVPTFAASDVIRLDPPRPGLPDNDVFKIVAGLAASPADQVVGSAKAIGSNLFGHALVPTAPGSTTRDLWVLNTEALNHGPSKKGEPIIAANFIDNRVTCVDTATLTTKGISNFDLADADAASQFGEHQVIGQPSSIAVYDGLGALTPRVLVFVAGSLTSRVTVLGPEFATTANPAPLATLTLPEGSIPRGIALEPDDPNDPSGSLRVAVFCFGTSKIEFFTVSKAAPQDAAAPTATAALSRDPLPSHLIAGRKHFFDGTKSARKNVSCASCHIDGGSDFLSWNLSGLPYDDKGVMVTQTLVGLERVSPFHWRGERTMEDFNRLAFPGLLGHGGALPESEFAEMKAWLFALKNPANPFQTKDRRIDPGATFTSDLPAGLSVANTFANDSQVSDFVAGGNALDGLEKFSATGAFAAFHVFEARFSCAECHRFPVGTNNDIFNTFSGVAPSERSHFKVTPFHEIWRKKMSLVAVNAGTTASSALQDVTTFLGNGLGHSGTAPDLFRFPQEAAVGAPVDVLPAIERVGFLADVAAFIQQWDQGLGQASHRAIRLMPQAAAEAEILYLLGQAHSTANSDGKANCDLVVLETVGATSRGWVLRIPPGGAVPSSSVQWFHADSAGLAPRSIDEFKNGAAWTNNPSLLIGLPVGMGERFAVDFDLDGRLNGDDDSTVDSEYVFEADSSDTVPPSGQVEVLWKTTNTARLLVTTDEPTALEIAYSATNSVPFSDPNALRKATDVLSRVHSVILDRMEPDTQYFYAIRAFDPDGSSGAPSLLLGSGGSAIVTDPFTMPTTEGSASAASRDLLAKELVVPTPLDLNMSGVLLVAGSKLAPGTVSVAAEFKQLQPGATSAVFALAVYRIPANAAPGTAPIRLPKSELVGVTGSTFAVDSVELTSPGHASVSLGSGGFIVSRVPATTLASSLSFRVKRPDLASGDRIIVALEAVVSCTSSAVLTTGGGNVAQIVVVDPAEALSQWDFPRSTEANLTATDSIH